MQIQEAERSGRLVIRAEGVSFSYGDQPVVRDFSTTLMRGDKVGIVGPNGSGKTTLLRLLLGELTPQAGTLRHGVNLEIAYFDQLRAQLEEDRTVMDNVADGRDFVTVNGRRRHVISYLADFLFASSRAGLRRHAVRRRAQPAAAGAPLRDPPTCWCWMNRRTTWIWKRWSCWKICCSNTRAPCSLSATTGSCSMTLSPAPWRWKVTAASANMPGVTRTGCANVPAADEKSPASLAKPAARSAVQRVGAADRPRRLTFKERQEIDALPQQIEALETEQHRLYQTMADTAIYQQGGDEVVRVSARLAEVERDLAEAYARWEQLETSARVD